MTTIEARRLACILAGKIDHPTAFRIAVDLQAPEFWLAWEMVPWERTADKTTAPPRREPHRYVGRRFGT